MLTSLNTGPKVNVQYLEIPADHSSKSSLTQDCQNKL